MKLLAKAGSFVYKRKETDMPENILIAIAVCQFRDPCWQHHRFAPAG
jgi:hypothetical protein